MNRFDLRRRRPAGVATESSTGRTLSYALMGLMLVYYLLPVWWQIANSTKSNEGLYDSPALWFGSENNFLGNIADVFTEDDGAYAYWLLNTVFYTAASGIGSLIVSTVAGYAFAKFEFPGKRLAFAALLGVLMVPATALVIPQFLVMTELHLINTPWAVIIPGLLNPFGVYLIRIYAQDAVSDELLEAGRLDGAGEIRTFWSVGLPLLRPAMATVLIFSLVGAWNNYFLPLLMLSDSRLFPITVGLGDWYSRAEATAGASTPLYNLVITGSLIAVLPLIVAFLVLQRHWTSGLAMGSLK